ncbi:four helix bundle protein [Rhodohalobacter barkolensis]|uniref:Diversity-generating retroelement protein bAvd family protein n=1 Tax=Rhodohalobacter barkolensis TaxID=2053187 RepID=A0A2N0VJJ7_9BACT|nr:four helix bundle protein [Rhodohalobacter barkolensis]PKD44349.1 diversity-generating retroelement protein bAvd family protein [Rhodohalobacter barkolensis]
MGDFKDLKVYQKSYNLAMEIFFISKSFPSEEKYALTSQIRRSSRSVSRSIAEGYRKRRYPNHFISKMSDADMENSETQVSLDFACSCGYITEGENRKLQSISEEVGKMLYHMMTYPEKYQARGTN